MTEEAKLRIELLERGHEDLREGQKEMVGSLKEMTEGINKLVGSLEKHESMRDDDRRRISTIESRQDQALLEISELKQGVSKNTLIANATVKIAGIAITAAFAGAGTAFYYLVETIAAAKVM